MVRVKLDLKPIASHTQGQIANKISYDHICAVNKNIEKKVQRNEIEKSASQEVAARYWIR